MFILVYYSKAEVYLVHLVQGLSQMYTCLKLFKTNWLKQFALVKEIMYKFIPLSPQNYIRVHRGN